MICSGFSSPVYFVFADSVPSLLYYSHIPTAIISLLMGSFIFFRSKNLLSRILLALSIVFFLWIVANLIAWTNINSDVIMFNYSFFGIFEPLIFILCAYFLYVFVNKRDISLSAKLFLGFIFSIASVFSYKNAANFNLVDCAAIDGGWYSVYYLYGVEMFFSIWIFVYGIYKYLKEKTNFKKQILFLIIGINLFLFSFFLTTSITGYLVIIGVVHNYSLEFYGLFSMTFFMGMLAYLIVKFKAFDIKLLGAQALVVTQIILVASQFAFVRNNTNRVLTAITLALTFVFGYFLIKAVKESEERKEQLQIMSTKLAQSNDQLRKLDNAKSEFISIASHQLRTPLTAIKGFISLLLEGSYGKIEPKQEDVLNKIYTSNERLVNLVEDLLNVSRMESGRMEFKFEKCQMDGVCQEVFDTFVLRAKAHKLYLEYVKPETVLPEVMVDGKKIREVVSNLVDNALKYTPDDTGGVKLKLEQVGENIRVTISDTGIGIPQEELPYLFAKFSRGKDVSRLNTGGTGLGLYVGRGMIENNGGKIWAAGVRFFDKISRSLIPQFLPIS